MLRRNFDVNAIVRTKSVIAGLSITITRTRVSVIAEKLRNGKLPLQGTRPAWCSDSDSDSDSDNALTTRQVRYTRKG